LSFLDRIRKQPKTPQEADALALRHLAGRGADLARPRHVIHFLYFSSEANARAAAAAIDEASWTTVVNPPDEAIAEWSVRADSQRIVGAETVAAFRTWFERVAAEHEGEYDGWEAAAKP
jgi:uncharacterized membrane-anchored protein